MNSLRFTCPLLFLGVVCLLLGPESSFAEPPQTGTFSGAIKLKGEIPVLPPLVKKGANVKDAPVCSAQDIPDPSLVVKQQNKGIANVFVYLDKPPENAPAIAAPNQVTLTCRKCQFEPHAQFVQAGQLVQVTNNDAVPENFHVRAVRNPAINRLLNPNDQQGFAYVYQRAERVPIPIKSDFHAWMSAWHLVLDHPYAAVTDRDGKFKIESLPEGEYEFRIWQEKAGWLEKSYKVSINAGKVTKAKLKYPAGRFLNKGDEADQAD